MAFTAVELNYILWRYLQDTGLQHSAFMFGVEAGVDKSLSDTHLVPRTALVTLVQKGLQYIEMEANMITTLNELEADFVLFQAMELVTKDVSELQKIAADRRKTPPVAEATNLDKQQEGGSSRRQDKEILKLEGKHDIRWGREEVQKIFGIST